MGFGGMGPWQLLIILAIVVLIFGTKKLRGMGTDLGSAIKGFRSSVKDDAHNEDDKDTEQSKIKAEQLPEPDKQDTTATSSSKTTNTEKDRV